MSADPKSLATLAITTAKTKPKPTNEADRLSSSNPSSSSSYSDGGESDRDNPNQQQPKSFRSTDEFVAGWTAAFINTTALFPINKLIFRQMAGGHGTQIAADQMKEEGIRYLYRGILPPLIQKMVSVSIMFGSFGHYKNWADRKFTNTPPIFNLALASCLTGTTEAVLTPLERVQMLLQDRKFHREYKNTIDALIKLRTFGAAEYYRGLTCVLMRNGPSNILFFGLRDEIKKLMPKWSDKLGKTNNINDSNSGNISNNNTLNSSTSSRALLILSQQHRNQQQQQQLHPLSNYTQANGYNNLQQKRQQQQPQRHKDSMLHDFLSGAILGMFISTLFYPLSVVRTRMQTRAPGTEFLSIVQAFNAVYSERDRKFTRLFHGCLINVLRQFVSWGIINCSYEYVLDMLHKIK